MSEWHTVRARFTSEEKKILDILHDEYGWNYNYSLKTGIEYIGRLIGVGEFYTASDSKILKKITRVMKKYNRLMNAEINQVLKEFPKEQEKLESEKLTAGRDRIFTHFDNVFVKNRKKGRKKLVRKKGRPSTSI